MKTAGAVLLVILLSSLLIATIVSLHRAMSGTPNRKERRRDALKALADGIRRNDHRSVRSVLMTSREDLPTTVIKDAEYWLLTGKSIHE